MRASDKPATTHVEAVLVGNKHALMFLSECQVDWMHAYAGLLVSWRHVWVWRAGNNQLHDRLRVVIERVALRWFGLSSGLGIL